jgi:hypothetical protein
MLALVAETTLKKNKPHGLLKVEKFKMKKVATLATFFSYIIRNHINCAVKTA